MGALKTLCLEGIFFKNGIDVLCVENGAGFNVEVDAEFEKLVDRQVRIAVMHVPVTNAAKGAPGGGSCYWKGPGPCPAGHADNPDRMLVFTAEGLLTKTTDGWAVQTFSGSKKVVPLHLMEWHLGRVVGATTDAVEKMRDALAKLDPNQQVEALSGQAGELREKLSRLAKVTGRS